MAKRISRTRSTTENSADAPKPTRERAASAADRKTPRRQAAAAIEPTDEIVRLAAYYRYLNRAGGPGDEVSDWIEAEGALKKD